MKKIRVGVIFGGRSAEHEVSLQSAKNIVRSLDPKKYEPVLLGIDKKGQWHAAERKSIETGSDTPREVFSGSKDRSVAIMPSTGNSQAIHTMKSNRGIRLDVAFPVLHGTYGEDGTVQGLLELLDIPYVGPGVLGSAVCMDKDVAKRLLRDANIPIADFVTVRKSNKSTVNIEKIVKKLKLPIFVKPANAGSSVGVSKVEHLKSLSRAIDLAFRFDSKIIIEKTLVGREIECSVLGNDDPKASAIGEIIPQKDFYSYEAKYIDENGATLEVPAKLPARTVKKIQKLAIEAYTTLECEGMARVDMFLSKQGEVYINEVNTIPGFTKISMYPKLWEISGLPYSQLLDTLIQLALERHKRNSLLLTSL